MSGRSKGIFDGLPIPADKSYLREGLSRIDESWAAARFDSLPHVVHILTSRDREGEIQFLKEQSDLIEDVVDEVVHAYHHGFNKAIQNYSQILRLFSESADSISTLKIDMAEARKLLGSRNKQLHQLWYRSLTLRHILSLLDQIEGVAKVPSRIEKLIAEKQLYAAVQLHVQSIVMLEREGLQVVGALQDVRTELTKLRGVLFFKILEELHSHLYNKGEYSSGVLSTFNEDEIPTAAIGGVISRRTRSMRGESQFGAGSSLLSSIDGGSSIDGHEEESSTIDGNTKDSKSSSHEIPPWLSFAVPDEFIEIMKKSNASTSEKYLQTLVECLCMLGKVAAAGAILCQRLRPTIHDIMTTEIKLYFQNNATKSRITDKSDFYSSKGFLEGHNKLLLKNKNKNGTTFNGAQQQIASPISPLMTPTGQAQCAASDLLTSILNSIIHILENHFIVGELLEVKSTQGDSINTPKSTAVDPNFSADSEASQVAGGYTVAFPLTVVQSECQQLICEILRATPEAATADAAVQTARLANKSPVKEKRDGSEGLSFAFRITDAAISVQNEGQGWKRGVNAQQEGYGTASVLPDQGIYLAASVYRPVLQFTDKIKSLLPQKYSQLGNDGLLSFVENFLKDHFLPAIFVDYRKCVQQAISTPAAFRPRVQATSSAYSPLVEKGRPVLQGLLAVDFLAKEVLGWAQLMPKYASELVEYVRTFLERTYERCRTSYMEVVLERQSYMLLGRSDVESLMRLEPANTILQNSGGENVNLSGVPDGETMEVERQISDLLLNLRPIKQENLIHDDQKLILLASLSDSLEYLADSIEQLGDSFISPSGNTDGSKPHQHRRSSSAVPKSLATLSNEYRKLAIDCLKVLRLEMQLETILHMQEMTSREYLEDQDADEPDDFIISLTSLITRRDEEMAPFVSEIKRNYIFGGISSVAANASIKALSEIRSINLLGVQQICRNSIALEQALAAIPSMDSEGIQTRLDSVRKYYELLNLPFESLIAYVAEHSYMFFPHDISSLLRVDIPGREIPGDAERRMAEILSH